MPIHIYILSIIFVICRIFIPIFLLFRLFFIVKPLLVNLYTEESFSYYKGINKHRLLILCLLFVLSSMIGILFSDKILNSPNISNVIFNVTVLAVVQFVLWYLFEMKTPVTTFEIIKNYFQNPKSLLKENKVVFEERESELPILQSGVSFKDSVNLTIGDIIKQVDQREFELIIEKHSHIFHNQSSIENLYKLCNGIEIKEKSILIKIDNKRNSKQNIAELFSSLFNIQKNWNSEIKERTNTKIVEFLNTYVLINEGVKTLHSNDFTRLFKKLD